MSTFILFATAYEIKPVTGKQRCNISCQTLGYSSQVNEQSQVVLLYYPHTNVHRKRRLSPNKQLLQIYGFSKAALTKQANIRFESRLRVGILMHEHIEHKRNTELYGVLLFCVTALQ